MALDALPAGMVQQEAPVVFNKPVAPDHYRMRLLSPRVARAALPGQFIHVRCHPARERFSRGRFLGRNEGSLYEAFSLLRRPFSLLAADRRAGTLDFIYKVVGTGTEALTQVRRGERIDLLGPLGRSFEIPDRLERAVLLGGGVGIPPLCLLAERLKERGVQVTALLGARKKAWVICRDDFKRLGVPARAATDDGSLGHRGSVVDLIRSVIPAFDRRRGRAPAGTDPRFRGDEKGVALFICGPTRMMAAAARLARRLKIQAQVSLEERMGCAMGCCWGCVVEVAAEPRNAHARFQRVCTEGPVFPAEAILWG